METLLMMLSNITGSFVFFLTPHTLITGQTWIWCLMEVKNLNTSLVSNPVPSLSKQSFYPLSHDLSLVVQFRNCFSPDKHRSPLSPKLSHLNVSASTSVTVSVSVSVAHLPTDFRKQNFHSKFWPWIGGTRRGWAGLGRGSGSHLEYLNEVQRSF